MGYDTFCRLRLATWLGVAATVATLCGCGEGPRSAPEPIIRTVTVKVATPVPCPALEALGPDPAYPDTDEAIDAAATFGQVAALYAKGRAMRVQRLLEYATARGSCIF